MPYAIMEPNPSRPLYLMGPTCVAAVQPRFRSPTCRLHFRIRLFTLIGPSLHWAQKRAAAMYKEGIPLTDIDMESICGGTSMGDYLDENSSLAASSMGATSSMHTGAFSIFHGPEDDDIDDSCTIVSMATSICASHWHPPPTRLPGAPLGDGRVAPFCYDEPDAAPPREPTRKTVTKDLFLPSIV